jgi:hypothetical protein
MTLHPIWPIIWRIGDILQPIGWLAIICLVALIVYLIRAALRGHVHFTVTRWQALPRGGYVTDYALVSGNDHEEIQATEYQRAARKAAVGR